MKSHGLLFTAEMVRAQLDGRKTQTRRLVTPANSYIDGIGGNTSIGKRLWERLDWSRAGASYDNRYWMVPRRGSLLQWHQITPRIRPGDGYWVRETFGYIDGNPENGIVYRATDPTWDDASTKDCVTMIWKPSIFMRRSESRITGIIPQVRAQFVQDISDPDALAEGCSATDMHHGDRLASVFARLWDSINTEPGTRWEDNPTVWAYTLERKQ